MLMQTVMITLAGIAGMQAATVPVTDALLGGIIGLLSFALYRLWILNGDMRELRIALTGLDGSNGLVHTVRSMGRTQARHGIALAQVSSRLGQLDGRDDVVLDA